MSSRSLQMPKQLRTPGVFVYCEDIDDVTSLWNKSLAENYVTSEQTEKDRNRQKDNANKWSLNRLQFFIRPTQGVRMLYSNSSQ